MGDTGLVTVGLGLCSDGLLGCPVVGETASEERARDTYGRGAGFLGSSADSGGCDGGGGSSRAVTSSSIPNSSMMGRGGGLSTMASRS
jgi:hypothetical protein